MKVLVTQSIPEAGTRLLESAGLEILMPQNPADPDEQGRLLRQADIVLNVGQHRYGEEFFQKYPNIRALALYSVGYDAVDLDAATAAGVPVGNTPDVLSRATSDVAFLLMQSVARKASFNFQKVRSGRWGRFSAVEDLGVELYGKTLGIFGMGRIGIGMARKCMAAFGMELIYHNRHRNPAAEKELGARFVSFEELVAQSDVLSIHANFSEEGRHLFSGDVFAKMKPSAILVNTARGGFIDEDALYKALQAGEIWGAGLDVADPEPMSPENPLLSLPGVCVLPHIGSATVQARTAMAELAAQNCIAFSRAEPMPQCVNPEVYKR